MSAQPSTQSPAAGPDPGSRASFELFEEHYFLNERWDELAGLYQQRIADRSLAEDSDERARLLLRLGRVQEEKAGDEDGAIASYRECVALSSEPRAALRRLRRLYKQRRSWATVLQVAELEIETTRDPAERARLYREMGDIWELELGDPEQAELLNGLARQEEGDPEPLGSQPMGGGGEPATVERARWLAGEGQTEQAVGVLRERLAGEPADSEALDLLLSLLAAAGRHMEMPDVLEQRAALATDGPTRASLLARLGRLREGPLGEPDAARSAYERAMGSDPANAEAGLALARIYRAHESWDALRRLQEARIAHAPPDQQVELLCELGDLFTSQLGDPTAASHAYDRARAIDPADERARNAPEPPGAAREIETSATASGSGDPPREPDLDDALAERLAALEAAGAGASANAIRLRLRLAERALEAGDAAGAIGVLEPGLQDDQALREVARPLRRLYERAGDHAALRALAQRAADTSRDPSERAAWYRTAADAAQQAGDVEARVELLERLLEEQPADRAAQDALLAVHRARGDARPLLAMLRRVLHRVAPGEEAPLHAEAARLLEDSLGDPDAAFVHWRRALALDPADAEVLSRALACAETTGGALRQLDLLELAADAASLPHQRARLLARRGELLTDALAWTDEGAESWRLSLELDPDQPGVRARLEACAAA